MGILGRMLALVISLGLIRFSAATVSIGGECWSSANGVAAGGCSSGTQCGPWLPTGGTWDGSSPWYCLAYPKLTSGATCDYATKNGLCDTGLTRCNGACASSSTTCTETTTTTAAPTTTTTGAASTAGTNAAGQVTLGAVLQALSVVPGFLMEAHGTEHPPGIVSPSPSWLLELHATMMSRWVCVTLG